MPRLNRAALLIGAVLLPAEAQALPPVPTYSPPECRLEARWTGRTSAIGQYLIEISLPAACPADAGRLARIRTGQGGIIPPIGYFRLGGGYPRKLRFYLFSPAWVLDRRAPNDWRPVPIQGVPWGAVR